MISENGIAFCLNADHTSPMKTGVEQSIRALIGGDGITETAGLIEAISTFGLKVQKKSGLLYLSDAIELLQAEKILSHVTEKPELEIHWSIGSTNSYLMELKPQPDSAIVCLAERQEAGKGRRGHGWVSPFGKNIYMSVGRKFKQQASELGGLSLIVGIQVIRTLRRFGLKNVGMKWPNDILLPQGKLAGILVEIAAAKQGSVYAVMGIGINFEFEAKDGQLIDQPWSALKSYISPSRNDVAGQLIENLLTAAEQFEEYGFASFRDEWNESNLYKGKEVMIHLGKEVISGWDEGVDDNGNLLLKTPDGMRVFSAGEVSLRPVV